MSEDIAPFSVRWPARSDSKFYAVDSGTYPTTVEQVDWRKSRNDNTMAIVRFRFDEVRVTKPKDGIVVERNRSLDNIFMFDLPFQIEAANNFLIATGVATQEQLDAVDPEKGMSSEEVYQLFEDTIGKELAVRVQKRKADLEKNPNARVDDLEMENRIQDFYAKDSRQYERAVNAVGATIDASKVTMAGDRKKR